jgi:hypothetical protein
LGDNLFWPDNRAVRGPEQIVAQDKPKADRSKTATPEPRKGIGTRARPGNVSDVPQQVSGLPEPAPVEHPLSSDLVQRSKVETRITEALTQPIAFNIEPQSLKDALDFVAARYQIPIMLDQKALEDANVDANTEVRLSAPGISLSDALQLVLGQLSAPLGYDIVHGVLMITTVDKIDDHLETIVYDCRDLVNMATLDPPVPPGHGQAGTGGQAMMQFGGGVGAGGLKAGTGQTRPPAKSDALEKARERFWANRPFIAMVINGTGTEFWAEKESISELGGLLIVRQNPRMHERIKALLASIRLMKKQGAFAALNDQYDNEAKKRAAEQSGLTARLAKLEHEVTQLRAAHDSSARPATVPAAK